MKLCGGKVKNVHLKKAGVVGCLFVFNAFAVSLRFKLVQFSSLDI